MVSSELLNTNVTQADVQRTHRFASDAPALSQARLREPLSTYPKDMFKPLRESRRIILENFPPVEKMEAIASAVRTIYRLLHGFNVSKAG